MKSETGLRYVRPAPGTYEGRPTLAGAGFSNVECRFFQEGEELEAAVAAGLQLSDHPALESPPPRPRLKRPGRLSSMILAGLLLLGGLWLTAFRTQQDVQIAASTDR